MGRMFLGREKVGELGALGDNGKREGGVRVGLSSKGGQMLPALKFSFSPPRFSVPGSVPLRLAWSLELAGELVKVQVAMHQIWDGA